jgi:flavorubredoxin
MRSRSWNRLRFEIEYALERGTTSNSYLIRGDRKALIGLPGESFTEQFLTTLSQQINPAELDYIIFGHINPNRASTLKVLLQQAPRHYCLFEPGGPSPGDAARGGLTQDSGG